MSMLKMTFSILTGIIAKLVAGDDWEPNFSKTCTDITYSEGGIAAICQLSGGVQVSGLDLGACMGVDQDTGYLIGQDNGNFSWPDSTCDCNDNLGSTAGYTLDCACTTLSNPYKRVSSTFDLNQVIGNTAGVLYCYSTIGVVTGNA